MKTDITNFIVQNSHCTEISCQLCLILAKWPKHFISVRFVRERMYIIFFYNHSLCYNLQLDQIYWNDWTDGNGWNMFLRRSMYSSNRKGYCTALIFFFPFILGSFVLLTCEFLNLALKMAPINVRELKASNFQYLFKIISFFKLYVCYFLFFPLRLFFNIPRAEMTKIVKILF